MNNLFITLTLISMSLCAYDFPSGNQWVPNLDWVDDMKDMKWYYGPEKLDEMFDQFKNVFKKKYTSGNDEAFRKDVFKKNLEEIKKLQDDPNVTFEVGVNEFCDETFEEFYNKTLMNNLDGEDDPMEDADNHGEKPKPNGRLLGIDYDIDFSLPAVIDWRSEGKVTPIQSQGSCGSCWAFSALASLESAFLIKENTKINFSKQELVDCSSAYGNKGCSGGLMSNALRYIMNNKIGLENYYTYSASEGSCSSYKRSKPGREGIRGYKKLYPYNVITLQKLVTEGVVAGVLEVQKDFQYYKSGIYRPSQPCGSRVNHAINIVGYNADVADPYFIIKNSWGTRWGESGYMRMAWGTGTGTCGLAHKYTVLPVI